MGKNNEIVEIKSINEAKEYISSNTTLVLDLDNTTEKVAEKHKYVGSDQWFGSLIQHALSLDLNKEEAVMAVITIYHAVHKHVTLSLIEDEALDIIKDHQLKKHVLAVTARSAIISEDTHKQLADIGISFAENWPRKTMVLENDVIFDKGILFCSGKNKAVCLEKLLNALNYEPDDVVMIDDKHHHLKAVKELFDTMSITFKGLRYSYLDKEVENYHLNKSEEHFKTLHPLFSPRSLTAVGKLKLATENDASPRP